MNEQYSSLYSSDLTTSSSCSTTPYYNLQPARIYVPVKTIVLQAKSPRAKPAKPKMNVAPTMKVAPAARTVGRRPRAATCDELPPDKKTAAFKPQQKKGLEISRTERLGTNAPANPIFLRNGSERMRVEPCASPSHPAAWRIIPSVSPSVGRVTSRSTPQSHRWVESGNLGSRHGNSAGSRPALRLPYEKTTEDASSALWSEAWSTLHNEGQVAGQIATSEERIFRSARSPLSKVSMETERHSTEMGRHSTATNSLWGFVTYEHRGVSPPFSQFTEKESGAFRDDNVAKLLTDYGKNLARFETLAPQPSGTNVDDAEPRAAISTGSSASEDKDFQQEGSMMLALQGHKHRLQSNRGDEIAKALKRAKSVTIGPTSEVSEALWKVSEAEEVSEKAAENGQGRGFMTASNQSATISENNRSVAPLTSGASCAPALPERTGSLRRFLNMFATLSPIILWGFDRARVPVLEISHYLKANPHKSRFTLENYALVSEVCFGVGALLAPFVLWILHWRHASKRTIVVMALLVHISGVSTQMAYFSIYTVAAARLLVGLSCAIAVWASLSFMYESLLSYAMPLCATISVCCFSVGTVLAKISEIGVSRARNDKSAQPRLLGRTFFLDGTILNVVTAVILLTMWLTELVPKHSALGYIKNKDNNRAMRLILSFNAEASSDVGQACLRDGACYLAEPKLTVFHLFMSRKSFRKELALIVLHFLWTGLGITFFFDGAAQEILYLPSHGSDVLAPIIISATTFSVLIAFIPSYLIIRSMNRTCLLLFSTLGECALLIIAAVALHLWRASDCIPKSTHSSNWVAIICMISFYQVLYSITFPSVLCSSLQSPILREAPSTLVCGVISFWIPSVVNKMSAQFLLPGHEELQVICGASGRFFGVSLVALTTALTVFFFVEDRPLVPVQGLFFREDLALNSVV